MVWKRVGKFLREESSNLNNTKKVKKALYHDSDLSMEVIEMGDTLKIRKKGRRERGRPRKEKYVSEIALRTICLEGNSEEGWETCVFPMRLKHFPPNSRCSKVVKSIWNTKHCFEPFSERFFRANCPQWK